MTSDIGLDELVVEFVAEAREDLEAFEQDVLGLEKDPESRALLDSAFRTLHTIKGTGSYFGFHRLEAVAHRGESVLASVRDGEAAFGSRTATAMLRLADVIRTALDAIERDGLEPEFDTAALEAELDGCLAAATADEAPRQRFGETLVAAGVLTPGDIAWAVSQQAAGDSRPIGKILLEAGLVDAGQIESVLTLQGRGGQDSTVRVEVELLDQLVQLVGALARTRDETVGLVPGEVGRRLDEVTRSLQMSVLRTRIESAERVWASLPRVVRDVAESSGKPVRLLTEGGGTVVDRTLLAAIKDPIVHLVRNAIDHGIETPPQRRAAGKPAEATVAVRAVVEGQELLVEVEDDGRGIDPARVVRVALDRGLVSLAEVAAMSEQERVELVMSTGLSTAERITHVSGRGTGMDVVRADVERAGGRVEIVNDPGRGCLVRLRLPHVEVSVR